MIRKINTITLIGTSHIAAQSLKEVKEFIENEQPDIVAVELDPMRLQALFSKNKKGPSLAMIRAIGVKGFLFSLLGSWAERKLGDLVGVKPGDEMKLAVKLAKKHKKKIALIDQPITITLKRFSQALTWKEKGRFVMDIINGLLKRKPPVEFDLASVPDDELIEKMIEQVKDRYPNVYKVLITERNTVLAKNLKGLQAKHPDKTIVAVLGAGHVKEVAEELKEGKITYSVSLG